MPLILETDGPIAGTLEMPLTWAQMMAAVPNLIGAWSAEGLASGALSSWAAAHGPGLLAQATAAAQPAVVDFAGHKVATFAVGDRLDLSGALTSGDPLTIAMRVNLLALTDNQALFGGNATWRCRWRSTSGGIMIMDTGGTDVNYPCTATGWHDVVVVQDAAGYSIQVDDGAVLTGSSPGATITALSIGALAANDVTTNWQGHVSRIALARAALNGSALATFKSWLAG